MRIVAVTGNRSDYDLMSYLYKRLNSDTDVAFKLIVTGAHLTSGYENSLEEMKRDGNDVLACINDIPDLDSLKARAIGISMLIAPMAEAIESYNPDLLIGVGDREEVPAAALVAAYMKIPFMHFFGGEFVPDGHPDNLARNATSKLATVHMVAMEEHRFRLLAMGEADFRIHVIGSVAIDKYKSETYIPKNILLESLGISHFNDYALVIYHPPADISGENMEIRNILKVLADKNINAIISYPNTDFNNSGVIAEFNKYYEDNRFLFYKNFNRNTIVNIFRNAAFQIGNSSAGIGESASVPLPVINVGSRNAYRAAQENVLFVSGGYGEIADAVKTVRSSWFKNKISGIQNLYGDGLSSQRAHELIKSIDYGSILQKKEDPLKERCEW